MARHGARRRAPPASTEGIFLDMQGTHDEPAAASTAPQTFAGLRDRYEVVRSLGRGGFGVTHLVRRERDGMELVVKQLRIDRMDDWKAFDLFEREAAVLEALKHPNVPAFVDHFEVKDAEGLRGFALVQEYVKGATLRELQRQRSTPSAATMRPWLERLLEICRYLHERAPPVIHRDISPKNVIVRDDGEPVLIDFGTVQNALRSADTISSTSAGTFGYAAPEQLIGRAVPSSDLYGVAMTYLAVATGREPEALEYAGNRAQVSAALREHDTHPRLALLLEELTDPDPDRRPASAAEVLARLDAIPHAGAVSEIPAGPGPGREPAAEDTPASRAEAKWRARAERAVRLGAAGALGPSPAPDTERLRGCTIDDAGAVALVELGFHDGRVAGIALDAYTLGSWDTSDVEDVFHPTVAFDREGGHALLFSFDKGALVPAPSRRDARVRPVRDLPWMAMSGRSDRGVTAVSPDREILACLDRDGIHLFGLESGGVVERLALDDNFMTFAEALRFSPDGSALLLEVTSDTCIVDTKGAIERLEDTMLALAPDGRTVALASDSDVRVGVVERWAPLTFRQAPRRLCATGSRPRFVRFSPDGRSLAFEQSGRVVVVDAERGDTRLVAGDPYRPGAAFEHVEGIGFSADGRRLFVVGRCTVHPLATERDGCLAVHSLTRGRPLGTVRLAEGDLLYGFTCLGIHGPIGESEAEDADGARARAILLDESPEVVFGEALDGALDLRDRIELWGAEVAAGRLPPEQDLARLVEASAGLTHLVPVAVRRAKEVVSAAPARFGATAGGGSAPAASALLDALAWIAAKSDAEREVLFDEMLPGVVEAEVAHDAEAARAAERIAGGRIPRALVIAALAAIVAGVVAWMLA